MTFRSLSETLVRRSCSVLLVVLATVVMSRGKKSVLHVAQCIAAFVPVHRTPSLLSHLHCFLNPSATSIRLHTLYTVFSYLSSKGRAKGKQSIAVSTWRHRYGNSVPYRITQCYLPPGRGDIPAFTPAEADPQCTNPEGCKAALA